ncbi:MAG TPA: hypothetical protein DEQ14_09840 [Treponema sp.]|nr:hypothetical protein [Treponema sp.]
MKRYILTFCALLFVAAGVSAELVWSGWGRGIFTPMAFSDGDSSVSAATYNTRKNPRVGFKINGSSAGETIGFKADFYWDGGIPAVGDNASVWVRPFPFLKLTVGKFVEDELRGLLANTEFTSWLTPNNGKGEDALFSRFLASSGAHISISPLFWLDSEWNGLTIQAAVGSNAGSYFSMERANRNVIDQDMADVYKAIQIGLGYKIPDIGFARVQFIGNNRAQLRYNDNGLLVGTKLMEGLGFNRDADVIEASFRFTMIDDLTVEAGVKIPLEFTTDASAEVYPALARVVGDAIEFNAPVMNTDRMEATIQLPYSFALGAIWEPGDFRIFGRADIEMGKHSIRKDLDEYFFAPVFDFWLVPSYNIFENFTVGLDFGMEYHGMDVKDSLQRGREELEGSDYFDMGFGPWVEYNVGGGTIKTGVFVMLPGRERYEYTASSGKQFHQTFSGKPVISVPISFTYSL